MAIVICQPWREYERGWGSRPDGCSLHLTILDRDQFVDAYNKKHNSQRTAPDVYSVASGDWYFAEVEPEVYAAVANSDCGIDHSGPLPKRRSEGVGT
jgi:hypothetical protein